MGVTGNVPHVNGFDVITVIRRALAKCPDEYPPPITTELLFIKDDALRESIRQDIGAAHRALSNYEWKAATVLAGAAIEALLHWRLREPLPGAVTIDNAVNALSGTKKLPFSQIDRWDLHQFIEVAAQLNLLKSDTCSAAKLAQNFRNLIHPGLECYFLMFSTLRSPVPEELLPRKVRFTCNPSGPGHNAVRHRFNLSGVPEGIAGPVITEVGKGGVPASRRMIFASFEDNVLLKRTEPEYMRAIEVACEGDPAKLRAWKYGDWSVISGGAFDGIFFEHAKTIYVEPFELPASGKCWMSYDHGSTKPYACLFWWESDGSDIQFKNGRCRSTRPHDLFLIGEVYGCTGWPNEGTKESIAEITTKIQSYKIDRGWRWRDPISGTWQDAFKRGFADNSIGEELNEFSVAVEFERPVRINYEIHPGIRWELVSKPPGSRVTGFALMRERLIATAPRPDSRIREAPGLFVVKDDCPNFVRTIPVLPRSTKNPDDVNSESEDHIFDAVKYMLQADRRPHMTTSRRQV